MGLNVKYGNGKVAISLADNGEGFVYYLSGRVCAMITMESGGLSSLFFNDHPKAAVVGTFDTEGQGSVLFPSGKPHVVVTKHGGRVSDEDSIILRDWEWYKTSSLNPPVEFQICQFLSFYMESLNKILFRFSCESAKYDFEVGVRMLRTDTYLDKVTGKEEIGPNKGKLILDVDKCRTEKTSIPALIKERAAKAPRAYQVTLDSLKSIVDFNSSLIKDIKSGDKFSATPYHNSGRSRPDAMKQTSLDLCASLKLTPDVLRPTNRGKVAPETVDLEGNELLDKFLEKSDTDHGFLGASKAVAGASGRYHQQLGRKTEISRRKLVQITTANYDEVINDSQYRNKLVVVCVLTGWHSESRKMELVLEMLNANLARDTDLKKVVNVSGYRRPATSGAVRETQLRGSEVVLLKFEGAESRLLYKKYNLRTTIMFLGYFNGKLVLADNAYKGLKLTQDVLTDMLVDGLQKAKRGQFMPADFKFDNADDGNLESLNQRLDYVFDMAKRVPGLKTTQFSKQSFTGKKHNLNMTI